MILTRKTYRGHPIELRSAQRGPSPNATRYAQVSLDGEVLETPQPCQDTEGLAHLLDGTREPH